MLRVFAVGGVHGGLWLCYRGGVAAVGSHFSVSRVLPLLLASRAVESASLVELLLDSARHRAAAVSSRNVCAHPTLFPERRSLGCLVIVVLCCEVVCGV